MFSCIPDLVRNLRLWLPSGVFGPVKKFKIGKSCIVRMKQIHWSCLRACYSVAIYCFLQLPEKVLEKLNYLFYGTINLFKFEDSQYKLNMFITNSWRRANGQAVCFNILCARSRQRNITMLREWTTALFFYQCEQYVHLNVKVYFQATKAPITHYICNVN